jgi:hypothetical protein
MSNTQRHFLTLTFDVNLEDMMSTYGITREEAETYFDEKLKEAAPHIPAMLVKEWRALEEICEVRAGTPTRLNPVAMLAEHSDLTTAIARETATNRLRRLTAHLEAEVQRRADAAVLAALKAFGDTIAGNPLAPDLPDLLTIEASEYEDGHFFAPALSGNRGEPLFPGWDIPGLEEALGIYGPVPEKAGLVVQMANRIVEFVENLHER